MNTLADIAIDHFCLLMFEGSLDPDDAVALSQSIPVYLQAMCQEERVALGAAAQRRVDYLTAEPDQHGYSPRKTVSAERLRFLRLAAAGDIYGG